MATTQPSALQQALNNVGSFFGNVGSSVQTTFSPIIQNLQKSGSDIVNNFVSNFSKPVPNQVPQGPSFAQNAIDLASNNLRNFNQPLNVPGIGNSQPINWGITTPGLDNLVKNINNGIPYGQQNLYPHFDFSNTLTQGIQNPLLRTGAQMALGIPESFLNTPYDVKQAELQTNKDISSGDILKPQTAISDVASSALPWMNWVGLEGGGSVLENLGKQTLGSAFKEGALTGAKYGGAFGFAGGLKSGRDATNPYQYLTNLATNTAVGAGVGSLLGGIFEPLLYMTGQSGIKPAVELYNKLSPEGKQAGFARFFMEFPDKIDQKSQISLAEKQGWFKPDFLDRLDQGKVSAGDLQRLGIKITKTDMRTLLKNAPEFADNPNLTFNNGLLSFQGNKIKFSINPDAIGVDATKLQPGDTINVGGVLSQPGKIPVLIEKPSQLKIKQPIVDQVPPETQPPVMGENTAQPKPTDLVVPNNNVAQPNPTGINISQPKPVSENVNFGNEGTPPSAPIPKTEAFNNPDNLVNYSFNKIDKFYTEVMDRFHPLSKIAKVAGEDQVMRDALTEYYGTGSIGKYHVDFQLKPILQQVPLNDLRTAGIAMRDLELAGRDIQGSNLGGINLDQAVSGKEKPQVQEALSRLKELRDRVGPEQMQKIGDTLQQLYKYQDNLVREYLVKTGVMSEKAYQAMKEQNNFYIPFKRQMDFVNEAFGVPPRKGAGSVSGQNIVKGIKGSEKQIIDPIESIMENTFKIVGLGKRQEVAKAIISLKDKLPEGLITKYSGVVGTRPSISLFENGKIQRYLVPQEIADAAKGLTEEQLNTVIKMFSYPTKFFRATATGINPEFALPNVARDVQSAFLNVGLNPLKFVQGFAHYIKQDKVYQDFLKYGGQTARVSIDRPFLQEEVGALAKPSRFGISIKKPSDVYHLLENFGAYSEQPTRIAAFQKAFNEGIKNGLSQSEAGARAAYAAQESTVNFARRGSKTQAVNAIYAFINARAQGTDRIIRTFKDNPVGASTRLAMITAAPAVALYAYNRGFKSYFDPRVVSQNDKQNNFIIMLSDSPISALGGSQFIKIPKGDVGKIANPLEEFMSYLDGKGGNVANSLGNVLASFSPFSNAGDLLPTVFRPPIENIANYNFFYNQPIVPDYKKNYPAEYQYTGSTMPLYKGIANKLAGVGVHVSPAQMQNLSEGYATGYAKIAGLMSQLIDKNKNQNQQITPTGTQSSSQDINKIPIVRRFLGGEKRTQEEQQLIDEKKINSINFNINDIKAGIGRGDIPLNTGIQQIQQLQKQQQDLISTFQNTQPGQTGSSVGDKINYLQDGKLKTIDLTPFLQPATGIEKYQLEAKKYQLAKDVYNDTGLTQDQKTQIYNKLGINPSDVQYDYLSSQPTKIKTSYLSDLSQLGSHENLINTLIQGRIQGLSGNMLVDNTTLNALRNQQLISAQEANYIRKLQFDAQGNNVGYGGGVGGTTRKITLPKIKIPKLSSSKLSLRTVRGISPLKVSSTSGAKSPSVKTRLSGFKATPVKISIRRPTVNIRSMRNKLP